MNDTPPGVNGINLQYHASGGNETAWLPYTEIRYYTNAFIIHDGKVLLGYKKRGFGIGKYNGFGGKVELGETPLQAAIRELEEEAGVTASLEHAGSLFFHTQGAEWAFQIEIYRADSYEGTISESDEMRPEWFSLPTSNIIDSNTAPPIPFSQMWDTDNIWLPLLIAKNKFVGRADFTKSGEKFVLCRWWYAVAPEELTVNNS